MLQLRVWSGGRAGELRRFTEDRFDVGRAEGVGLRFDPGSDLQVSAVHARFERHGADWWVEDLGSRNGTWIDGEAVRGPARVRPGQRIRFGWEGPEVEVVAGRTPVAPDAEVRGLARRNRLLAGLIALLVVALGTVVVAAGRARESARAAWERERQSLLARTDSALAAGQTAVSELEGEVDGLAEALSASRSRVQDLQGRLDAMARSGRPDSRELAQLRAQIDEATAAMSGQRRVADLDVTTLLARIRPAVVMVYSEFADGRRSVATGFAVSTGGRVVTNRHVVAGPDGDDEAVRIGLQFSGSPQVWPADLVRTSDDADLALVQIRNLVGGNPSVSELNTRPDTLAVGAPVLLIGFPEATPNPTGGPLPRAAATAGAVLGIEGPWLEIDGWGSAGASGSPVVDGDGRVVGVLVGAADAGLERRLVAVPASRLAAFLRRD